MSETTVKVGNLSQGLQNADGEVRAPKRPYKFLDYFEAADRPIFFGRDEEAEVLRNQIMAHKLTVLFGPSGVGKTSLIKAGVIPRLEEEGYTSLYIRVLHEPTASIQGSVGDLGPTEQEDLCSFLERTWPSDLRLVIFLDQFEEFFVRLGRAARAAFAEELATCLESDLDLCFVLSLRDDYLGSLLRLHSLSARWPEDILLSRLGMENLDVEKARLAITQPAQAFKLKYEDELLEALLDDLEQEAGEGGFVVPPQLQIVCYKLYENLVDSGKWVEGSGRSGLFTLESYKELGGAKGVLASYLDDALAGLPNDAARERAWDVLRSMITVGEAKATLTIQERPRQGIAHQLGLSEDDLEDVLAYLQDRRLIRWLEGERAFELAHEYMVNKIWVWESKEDVALKRASSLLRRELSNYQKLGLLMGRDGLEVVSEPGEALLLNAEELAFVFRSALSAGYEMGYWLERARDGGLAVKDVLKDELESEVPNTRANVAKVLREIVLSRVEGLSLEETVAWLAALLKDDYLNVRAEARQSLLKVGTGQALAALRHDPPPEMILIPAGNFLMGDEKQSVSLDAFYVDKYPVTNAEYARFLEATGHPPPPHWEEAGGTYPPDVANHPVVFVNWFDAQEYAAWAGKRLLTEAEWEKAARGTDGRAYPWGDEFNRGRCNTSEAGLGGTTPVEKYSPMGDSPYQVCDMAGNVWEWTATDWAPGSSSKVQRGGSFANRGSYARCAYRYLGVPGPRTPNVGFRCGMSASTSVPE